MATVSVMVGVSVFSLQNSWRIQKRVTDLTSKTVETSDVQQRLTAELESRESRLADQASNLERMKLEIEQQAQNSKELQNRLNELSQANQKLMAAQSEADRYREWWHSCGGKWPAYLPVPALQNPERHQKSNLW